MGLGPHSHQQRRTTHTLPTMIEKVLPTVVNLHVVGIVYSNEETNKEGLKKFFGENN